MAAINRVLVTGATGFIGRALCQQLRARHEVLALIRPDSTRKDRLPAGAGIRPVWGDVGQLAGIAANLGRIDAVVHLAWGGMSKPAQADAAIQHRDYANAMALVEVAAAAGCRLFVNGGSQAEYGRSRGVVVEESPCGPVSEYGKAKLRFTQDGSALATRLGMRWRTARIFSVFGPDDHPWTMLSALLQALARREVLPLTDCQQLWNYLYVDDAARALQGLLEAHGEDGIYNIGSGTSAPMREFVLQACALFPESPLPQFGCVPHPAAGPVSLQPSVQKLQRNTGWFEQIHFGEGIRRMCAALNLQPVPMS
jgi:nucleoside-diphosphate-sugar epimerase